MENSIKFSSAYPLNILIAEPCHETGSSTHDVLIQLGYRPELATTSQEMLKMSTQNSYDVILMDTQLPDVKSALASRINDTGDRRPIFIAMTMSGRSDLGETYLNEGMDHSISKPIDPAELSLQLMACSVLTGNRRIRSAS